MQAASKALNRSQRKTHSPGQSRQAWCILPWSHCISSNLDHSGLSPFQPLLAGIWLKSYLIPYTWQAQFGSYPQLNHSLAPRAGSNGPRPCTRPLSLAHGRCPLLALPHVRQAWPLSLQVSSRSATCLLLAALDLPARLPKCLLPLLKSSQTKQRSCTLRWKLHHGA